MSEANVYQIKLDQFEGPMDLLLQLIEGEKLDITSISLSKVTDQYVAYLKEVEEKRPEDFADFLYIAARLLYLKSKTLLPYLKQEEEQDAIPLELQLKLYKEFYEASKKIHALILKRNYSYFRSRPLPGYSLRWGDAPNRERGVFIPPKNVSVKKLAKIFREILDCLEPIIALPKTTLKRVISIKEKISQIISLVSKSLTLNFKEVIKGAKSKTEVVVSFLALLQLVKDRVVDVKQKKLFDEIVLKKS